MGQGEHGGQAGRRAARRRRAAGASEHRAARWIDQAGGEFGSAEVKAEDGKHGATWDGA